MLKSYLYSRPVDLVNIWLSPYQTFRYRTDRHSCWCYCFQIYSWKEKDISH